MDEDRTPLARAEGAGGVAVGEPFVQPPPQRTLRRRADHRLLAGVAGGLADYTGVRPIVFRLAFLLFTFFGGVGVLIYLLLWWLIPRADLSQSAAERAMQRFPNAPSWAGVALLLLGAVLLAGQFGLWRANVVWAFLLIGLGVVLFRRDAERTAQVQPGSQEPADGVASSDAAFAPLPAVGLPRVRKPRERSALGWLTFGALLLALGVAAVLSGLGIVSLLPAQYPALALIVLGIGLLVGAVWGRARWLILLGIPMIPAVLVASLVRVPLEGGFHDVYVHPRSPAELASSYRVTYGTVDLELQRMKFGRTPVRVAASVGLGNITVIVPKGVRVEVATDVGGGGASIGSRGQQGFGLSLHRTIGARGSEGVLIVEPNVGIGYVSVYHDMSQPIRPNHRRGNGK